MIGFVFLKNPTLKSRFFFTILLLVTRWFWCSGDFEEDRDLNLLSESLKLEGKLAEEPCHILTSYHCLSMAGGWLLEYNKTGFEQISSLYWLGKFEQET